MGQLSDSILQKIDKLKQDPARYEAWIAKKPAPARAAIESEYEAWKAQPHPTMAQNLQDVGRGAAQGVTFGWGDEINGAIQAGLGKVLPEKYGGYSADDTRTFDERYQAERDAFRNEDAQAKERSPYLYGGGELAANLVTGAAIPGGKLAQFAGNVGMGAVQGAGNAEDEDFGDDALVGAGLAGAGSLVGQAVGAAARTGYRAAGKAVKWAGNKVDEMANNAHFEALKPNARTRMDYNKADRLELGERLKNEDAVKAFDRPEDIAQRLEDIKKSSIEDVEGAEKAVDALPGSSFKPQEVYDDLNSNVVKQMNKRMDVNKFQPTASPDVDMASTAKAEIDQFLKTYGEQGDLSFSELANFRRKLGNKAWSSDTRSKDALKQVVGRTSQLQNDKVLPLDVDAYNAYTQANKRFGDIDDASKIVRGSAARNEMADANTPLAAGVGGAIAGGMSGGVTAFVASRAVQKFAKDRGSATAAVALKTLGNLIPRKDGSGTVAKLLYHSPDKLGAFAEDLIEAASRSEEAFDRTHEILMKSDEYRQLVGGNEAVTIDPSNLQGR
jgi:hypothetical protein